MTKKKDRIPAAIVLYKLPGHDRWSHSHCNRCKDAINEVHQTRADYEGAKAYFYKLESIEFEQLDLFNPEEEELEW